MKPFSILACLTVASVAGASAPVATDSPTDVVYQASFNKTIDGYVKFSSTNGSVLVDVKLLGLPETGGPFLYHIHEKPVPASGNCSATLGHFNPFGGDPKASAPQGKEIGDLSGKHGLIEGTSISTSYIDEYLSLNPNSEAYFGGLSVVVHFKNTSRLACANISLAHTIPVADSAARSLAVPALPFAAGIVALML